MDNNIKQDAFVQGLEQAAELAWDDYTYRGEPQCLYSTCYKDGFLAGGKWMAQQIYNAIITMVENNDVWMH